MLEESDGAKALTLMERHEGPIHLLITDVVMPGMGGRESMSEFQRGEDIAVGTSGGTDSAAIPKG